MYALATFRTVCNFSINLRFELFHALVVALDPTARVHRRWAERARARLPARFHEAFRRLGASPHLFAVAPDLLDPEDLPQTQAELARALRGVPRAALRERFLRGLLHDDRAVEAALAGADLGGAISRIPKKKTEWLAFMGLYPFRPDAPLAAAVERIRRSPEAFRDDLLVLVESFWQSSFGETWAKAAPELARSLQQAERLFAACTLEEFAARALLRVTVDERGQTLTAIRGGYRVRLEDIASCHFMPSMFNDRRYWSAYPSPSRGVVVHFPYFDPALSPIARGVEVVPEAEPEIDPRLVFRALGDATRYALVTLLARGPATSTELAGALAISKPTMSHHLNELRAAGLVSEERSEQARRSVTLRIRRDVFERLSAATVAQLFDDPKPIRALPRSRLEKTRSTS